MKNKTIEIKLSARISLLDSKPIRGPNKIIEGHVPSAPQAHPLRANRDDGIWTKPKAQGDGRALPRELIDEGQGKCERSTATATHGDSDMDNSVESTTAAVPQEEEGGGYTLLDPPIINTTGKIATRATTKQLRKQNKLLHNATLREQPINGQWVRHEGKTFFGKEHWEQRTNTAEYREMAPQGLAQKHEAADLLADWAKFGCPTQSGRDWMREEIQAAIDRGPHKSVLDPTPSHTSRKRSPTR